MYPTPVLYAVYVHVSCIIMGGPYKKPCICIAKKAKAFILQIYIYIIMLISMVVEDWLPIQTCELVNTD